MRRAKHSTEMTQVSERVLQYSHQYPLIPNLNKNSHYEHSSPSPQPFPTQPFSSKLFFINPLFLPSLHRDNMLHCSPASPLPSHSQLSQGLLHIPLFSPSPNLALQALYTSHPTSKSLLFQPPISSSPLSQSQHCNRCYQ